VKDIRDALEHSHAAMRGLEISIVSKTGAPLLADGDFMPASAATIAQMTSAQRGSLEIATQHDADLVGYARLDAVPELGWFVLARQPASAALATAHTLASYILLIGGIVAIAGFLGSIVIAGRVSRPLRSLTEKADLIGRDSTDMLPRVRGSLEVVQLSTALRSLLLRVGRAERQTADIETRAADQTRRLESDIEALRSIVDIDALTGIHNRRGFMKFATDAMAQFRRYDRPFAILMIDVDHFKSVNDTFGHATGDAAICQIARNIGKAIRPSDKFGRFGGEEFIVLLREVSPETTYETAERIRAAVAADPLLVNGVHHLLTISVGLAIAGANDRDIQDIVERADIALYAAKGAGRNRVSIAGSNNQDARLSA
jgi:diguanylate cyclase (GGDEF)-like protein